MSSHPTRSPEERDKALAIARTAAFQLASGDRVSAVDNSRDALRLDRNCFSAHALLATIALIGEDYHTLLRRAHLKLRPRSYLEIGVETGATIRLAHPETLAIGVDPAPQLKGPLPSNVRIVQATSDDFFARYDLAKEFDERPIDLAFIDGMHLFEFALRDFINIERNAAPTSIVLLHDCYPLDEATALRERSTTFWTGDVWKLVICLKKHRPDLKVHTLASPPTGLTVVRGLDPNSRKLESQLDVLYREFIDLPYATLGYDKGAALNLVPGNWDTACTLLD